MSYVSEVADLISALSTNDSVLGPHDYLIISGWEKQVIPLILVLTSLREYFADQDDVSDASLVEIKQEVKNKYAAWLNDPNMDTLRTVFVRFDRNEGNDQSPYRILSISKPVVLHAKRVDQQTADFLRRRRPWLGSLLAYERGSPSALETPAVPMR